MIFRRATTASNSPIITCAYWTLSPDAESKRGGYELNPMRDKHLIFCIVEHREITSPFRVNEANYAVLNQYARWRSGSVQRMEEFMPQKTDCRQ